MNLYTIEELVSEVHASWLPILDSCRIELSRVVQALNQTTEPVVPKPSQILRALHDPRDQVRVLIVGQDPYPTPGHAMGLAFSVAPGVTPPRSLRNVFTELRHDTGLSLPDGDLTPWVDQGVLLLNRVLTTEAGRAGAHEGLGWQAVTDAIIRSLEGNDVVSVLWGQQAAAVAPLLRGPVLRSAHPSPLSARRGFFGSRPFSSINAHLAVFGYAPIVWGSAEDFR